MIAVTPTDRPKSVYNSCEIKVFGGVFMLSRCFLDCSDGVGVYVTGLSQISAFFSFGQNVYFSIFWINIILRLVCINFNRIAVKISFLWCPKQCVYAAGSFSANVTSWCLRNDTQIVTSVILYMNIIFIAQ